MSNSLVHSLEGYLRAMFSDIAWQYGSSHDMERDLKRSLHELVRRGDRFVTIDLPALRKHLEKCLEEGLYTPSNLYLSSRVSKRILVPAYCRDLYLQIFDVEGKLRPMPDVGAITCLRQLFEGWGKLKNVCKQEAIDEEVRNFLTNERELRSPTLDWSSDVLVEALDGHRRVRFCDAISDDNIAKRNDLLGERSPTGELSTKDAASLERVCDIISSSFGDVDSELESDYISERPRHGTGRVSNQPRTRSKNDFSNWPRKLDLVFPYDRYAVSDLGYQTYLDDFSRVLLNHEAPSKLIAVPKTMSGPRLIGSEPNYHQWIQQLIRNQLENRTKTSLLKHCISFGDQRPNRTLSLTGSHDRSIATVDLKSASDRLSCWTVERALRANYSLLRRIHASRTRTMRNAINDHFDTIVLKKCFTQGSACTFPVQTIVYSMLAISAVLITEDKRMSAKNITRASRKVRVFGDDIIVPTYALPKLKEILSFLQLTVNLNKTFYKGHFRESCGLDAYDGVDVTPARVKRFSSNPSHEVAESMLKCSNNYFERGYWNTATWLLSFLRKYDFPIKKLSKVSSLESNTGRQDDLYDSGGISSFSGSSNRHLRKRWNNDLQLHEYRIHRLTSKSKKVPTQSAYDLLEFTFSKRNGTPNPMAYLSPVEGGLGVVDKKVSVMKPGWASLGVIDSERNSTI